MTIEEALRDAVVTAQCSLREAIQVAIHESPDLDPDDDQAVQWWAGHVATWRLALGDSPEAIADDYDTLVVNTMEGR